MFTFYELLKTYNIDPLGIRLVRHGNKEINILDTFINDKLKFAEYTAWQRSGKFGSASYLAIFSPARGTTSLFLGLWEIKGCTFNADLKPHHMTLLKNISCLKHGIKNQIGMILSHQVQCLI